jgi:hypothetical protein
LELQHIVDTPFYIQLLERPEKAEVEGIWAIVIALIEWKAAITSSEELKVATLVLVPKVGSPLSESSATQVEKRNEGVQPSASSKS